MVRKNLHEYYTDLIECILACNTKQTKLESMLRPIFAYFLPDILKIVEQIEDAPEFLTLEFPLGKSKMKCDYVFYDNKRDLHFFIELKLLDNYELGYESQEALEGIKKSGQLLSNNHKKKGFPGKQYKYRNSKFKTVNLNNYKYYVCLPTKANASEIGFLEIKIKDSKRQCLWKYFVDSYRYYQKGYKKKKKPVPEDYSISDDNVKDFFKFTMTLWKFPYFEFEPYFTASLSLFPEIFEEMFKCIGMSAKNISSLGVEVNYPKTRNCYTSCDEACNASNNNSQVDLLLQGNIGDEDKLLFVEMKLKPQSGKNKTKGQLERLSKFFPHTPKCNCNIAIFLKTINNSKYVLEFCKHPKKTSRRSRYYDKTKDDTYKELDYKFKFILITPEKLDSLTDCKQFDYSTLYCAIIKNLSKEFMPGHYILSLLKDELEIMADWGLFRLVKCC
ncbi:MAG: hypothetical protein PHS52_03895 [Desulfotomaculaceae bacterium]|nr:hypothetical protein [Desulfotomaculaceae bacterium]